VELNVCDELVDYNMMIVDEHDMKFTQISKYPIMCER